MRTTHIDDVGREIWGPTSTSMFNVAVAVAVNAYDDVHAHVAVNAHDHVGALWQLSHLDAAEDRPR